MPMATPELQRAYMAEWYQRVVRARREKWLKENGPCKRCGSWERLQVDHVDPATKVNHAVWTWSEQRRTEELKKCQVLCEPCHHKKTAEDLRKMDVNAEKRIISPVGMAWCNAEKHFASTEEFTKNLAKRNGLENECITCRRKRRSPGRVGLSESPSRL